MLCIIATSTVQTMLLAAEGSTLPISSAAVKDPCLVSLMLRAKLFVAGSQLPTPEYRLLLLRP